MNPFVGFGMGICYYQTTHKDTAAVSPGMRCGEYEFTAATTGEGSCAATAVNGSFTAVVFFVHDGLLVFWDVPRTTYHRSCVKNT